MDETTIVDRVTYGADVSPALSRADTHGATVTVFDGNERKEVSFQ